MLERFLLKGIPDQQIMMQGRSGAGMTDRIGVVALRVTVIPVIELRDGGPLIRDLPDHQSTQHFDVRTIFTQGDPGSTDHGARKVWGRDDRFQIDCDPLRTLASLRLSGSTLRLSGSNSLKLV
jgi:hypothetical protein